MLLLGRLLFSVASPRGYDSDTTTVVVDEKHDRRGCENRKDTADGVARYQADRSQNLPINTYAILDPRTVAAASNVVLLCV